MKIQLSFISRESKKTLKIKRFNSEFRVQICRFPLPLGVWEGLRFVIVALPGLFSYLSCSIILKFVYLSCEG